MLIKELFQRKPVALALPVVLASIISIPGCGGDSSSSSGSSNNHSGTVLKAFGGLGGKDGGTGGDADYFDTYSYSGGKHLITPGGSVNAGFSATKLNNADTELGEKPLVVDSDLSLPAVAAAADKPASGTYYLEGANPYRLMLSDGDTSAFNAAEEVSGVQVNKRSTLTLANNNGNLVNLDLEYDLLVKGTLAVADVSATNRAHLNVEANNILIWGSGMIDTAGTQDGQEGGYIDLYPNYSFVNHGTLRSFGADSDTTDAGDGGNIYVEANYRVENTGEMLAHGGSSTAGAGGDAGYINLYAEYGNLLVRNKLHSYGGDGSTDGGDGDSVYLEAEDIGDVRVSGQIWTHGGDGADGSGGDADYVNLYGYGGGVYVNADIRANGGNASGMSDSGGDGGDLYIYNEEGTLYEYTPAEGIFIAGRIDTSGGDANAEGSGDGGGAGYVEARMDAGNYSLEQPIEFRGFRRVDVSGGDGQYGGEGGDVSLYADYGYNNTLSGYVPSGGIDIRTALIANGGNALADATGNGYGGDGGDINLETDYEESHADSSRGRVQVSARMENAGGQSNNSTSTGSAESGDTDVWGYNGVHVSRLISGGGDDLATDGGTDGYGGNGGNVDMASELGTLRIGHIDSSGGDGEYRGADADYVYLAAAKVELDTLITHGGDADASLAGSTGGDTSVIWVYSPRGREGVSVGSLQSDPGTGNTPGSADNQYVDIGGICSGLNC